jgi:hypothetical protein
VGPSSRTPRGAGRGLEPGTTRFPLGLRLGLPRARRARPSRPHPSSLAHGGCLTRQCRRLCRALPYYAWIRCTTRQGSGFTPAVSCYARSPARFARRRGRGSRSQPNPPSFNAKYRADQIPIGPAKGRSEAKADRNATRTTSSGRKPICEATADSSARRTTSSGRSLERGASRRQRSEPGGRVRASSGRPTQGGVDAGPGGGWGESDTGARGDWPNLKSAVMSPTSGLSSRTSGRGSGRPSVTGSSR